MERKGILLVVSGFSGAGKGTLMKSLVESYDNYALSISMTTRKPREGEENGKAYFFVEESVFLEKIKEEKVIEYAQYCGNYYGTPKEYVEEMLHQGKDVILEIEIQGALKVKEKYPDALLLFVMPPSAEELKRRLVGRGTETEEVISQRLLRASEEAEGIEAYDYILINDKLEDCVKELHNLVMAAHNTPDRNQEFINHIRKELKGLLKGE
ncbi:MAG: guanylate kinase [Lachnospiraceae bacterium]|nr:guanylate kinase [Lachnospiraceae bacterium]